MNNGLLDSWLTLKEGDVCILKDFQSLKQNLSGLIFTIERIEKVNTPHAKYRILKFKEKTDRLVVKYVDDQAFDLRWYYAMDWIGEGSRADILDKGHYFFFQNPGKDDFVPKELNWSVEFSLKCNDKDIIYQKIDGSEQYGEITTKKDGSYFVGVVEYRSIEDADDPYILILEVGGIEDGNVIGGYMTTLEGHSLNHNDIEVLVK